MEENAGIKAREEQILIEQECPRQKELRRELVRFSKWLSRLGFTPGSSGNLSVRLDSERLLVTPTGVSKGLLKAKDMVIVDMRGRLLSGTRNVTSEIGMHLAVYQRRSDVEAIVHAHPVTATAFACSGRALDDMLCQEAVMTLGCVPLAAYATTGTEEVAATLRPYLEKHDAILLENHGVVSYGATLLQAFMKMETVEHLAHVALISHTLGSPRPLQAEQVRQLQDAKAKYQHNAKGCSGAKAEPDKCNSGQVPSGIFL